MQKLTGRHGQETTDKALRFLTIRLKSRPESAHLGEGLEKAREELRGRHEAYQQAKEERIASTAEIQYLDNQLDQIVMELSRQVLVETKNVRSAPKYRKLFPSPPSEQMKTLATEAQERFVKSLLARLSEDEDYSHLNNHMLQIEESQGRLSMALGQRNHLYQKEMEAETNWRIAKDEVQRNYNLTYHMLQLTFPDNLQLVESFFSKLSKRPSTGDQEEQNPVE